MTMKWCIPHWNALRQSINDAGMEHLVSQGGAAAAKALRDSMEGRDEATFDPLLAAWMEIDKRFMAPLGSDVLWYFTEEAGDRCSLCELGRLNQDKPGIAERWIGGATKDVREECVRRGLIK